MASYETRNLRDGVLTVFDKANSVHHTVTLDEGDLSWTQTNNVIEVLDRGVLDHIRKGDESPMDVSFSMKYQNLQADSATTTYEAIKGIGEASAWDSTRGEDVYCVSLVFQVLNTSDAVEESINFRDFFWTSIEFSEGDEYNTLAVSGRSFRTTPTIA